MAQETVTTCDGCGEPIDVESEPHFVLSTYAAWMPYPTTAPNGHYHPDHWPKELDDFKPGEASGG
jgi:hypothetical protein